MPNLRSKTWTTTTPATVGDAQYWEDHLISDTAAAKAASSVQTVNSVAPDADGNVDVSVGHTIQNASGTDMPYQSTLQFTGADVSNDSVNGKTVVDCHGEKGDAATIAVGTVTTLPAGSDATVTNAGTSSAAVFNFGIPQGQDGSGAVDSVNGQTGTVVLDAEDVGALPDSTTIPTKTSQLTNDSNFVNTTAMNTAITASESSTIGLLDDTVGWVGKNELQIPSSVVSSGIYTVNRNSDGEVTSIVANGTPSTQANLLLSSSVTLDKPMILNGCPVGGSDDDYFIYIKNSSSVYFKDYGSGVYLDAGTYTELTIVTRANIAMSNISFMPMFRDAKITDSTFEPYHKPVSEWGYTRQEANVLGAKQWFNTKDLRNSDGVTIVTANKKIRIQNATASSWFGRFFYIPVKPNTDYLYTVDVAVTSGKGCVSVKKDSDGTDIVTEINIASNGRQTLAFNSGSETTVRLGFYSTCGTSETGDISYDNILITLAGDTDRTWVDFAMTNQQLTEKVNEVELWTGTVDIEDGSDHEITLSESQLNFKYLRIFFKSNYNVNSIVDFPTDSYNMTRFGVTSNTVVSSNSGMLAIRLTATNDATKIQVRSYIATFAADTTFNVVKVVGIK